MTPECKSGVGAVSGPGHQVAFGFFTGSSSVPNSRHRCNMEGNGYLGTYADTYLVYYLGLPRPTRLPLIDFSSKSNHQSLYLPYQVLSPRLWRQHAVYIWLAFSHFLFLAPSRISSLLCPASLRLGLRDGREGCCSAISLSASRLNEHAALPATRSPDFVGEGPADEIG